MKKQAWPLLLTTGLVLILAFCLYVQKSSASEEILCWNQDDERCFVFLPSYADLNRTEVQLNASKNCRLGGIPLTQGLNCGSFSIDTDYELTGDGFAPKTLQFVQSANVAAMYVNTYSGKMERVQSDHSYRELATTTVYTVSGQVDYQ